MRFNLKKHLPLALNVIFGLHVLLAFLLVFDHKIELPVFLHVMGRLHPLALHLPIGFLILIGVWVWIRRGIKGRRFKEDFRLLLALTSFCTVLTALLGVFLSHRGDYGEGLSYHKYSGAWLSAMVYALLLLFYHFRKKRKAFYISAAITFLVLVYAGHTGSVLTHGEGFILEPIAGKKERNIETNSVYEFAIEPVFESKCFSCHNPSKKKGGLVMTDIEQFKAGGKNGPAWDTLKPEEGLMLNHLNLPVSDEKHMPPEGKPQLTYLEKQLIRSWLLSGAGFNKKFNDLGEQDSLRGFVLAMGNAQPKVEEKTYTFSAASPEAIAKLNTPFCSVFPLYRDAPALQADFFIREKYNRDALEALDAVAGQLVVLNLSNMPVEDGDLSQVGKFKNLEKLNLNNTQVTGKSFSSLRTLKNLTSIALSGTSVDAKSLEPLLEMENLKEIYVWNTPIKGSDTTALSKINPRVRVYRGVQAEEGETLRLNPPIVVNEGIQPAGIEVVLKHTLKGAIVLYTLDGTKPDSVTGTVYAGPFKLGKSTPIKAIACMDTWYCSKVMETILFMESKPGARVELYSTPDPQYPGRGAEGLTDKRKGFADVFRDPDWLGLRGKPLDLGVYIEKGSGIKTMAISYARNIRSYLFPPMKVEVWGGTAKGKCRLLHVVRPAQPETYGSTQVEILNVDLGAVEYPYYNIKIHPVPRLPEWHFGTKEKDPVKRKANNRGWIFVDEVFFY